MMVYEPPISLLSNNNKNGVSTSVSGIRPREMVILVIEIKNYELMCKMAQNQFKHRAYNRDSHYGSNKEKYIDEYLNKKHQYPHPETIWDVNIIDDAYNKQYISEFINSINYYYCQSLQYSTQIYPNIIFPNLYPLTTSRAVDYKILLMETSTYHDFIALATTGFNKIENKRFRYHLNKRRDPALFQSRSCPQPDLIVPLQTYNDLASQQFIYNCIQLLLQNNYELYQRRLAITN